MATCFIFTHDWDETHCLCSRLDEQGHVEAVLAKRSLAELRDLQNQAKTTIVLPGEHASIHRLALPWLGERKAREAIPYALEEQLAQNVASLHFAFDKQHYQNNQYLIVVMDQPFLAQVINKLDALALPFDKITLDWFALKNNEVAIIDDRILINTDVLQAVLSGEMAKTYLKQVDPTLTVQTFTDSNITTTHNQDTHQQAGLSWIAEQLEKTSSIDLCQGVFRRDTHQQLSLYWYKISAVLAGVLLAVFMMSKMVYLHTINRQLKIVDDKIAVIYREFFPQAAQVISPRFRIGQLLANNSMGSNLWSLLKKFSKAMNTSSVTIQQVRFQNNVMTVTLQADTFAALEQVQSLLQQNHLKVTQLEASNQNKIIIATWELRLEGH